jgi:hypothetical protein
MFPPVGSEATCRTAICSGIVPKMSTFDLENPKPLVGDSLRDETANLLSVRFGRPTREDLVMGKKVDLHFIKVEFGKTTHIFVETKDYAKPLTREQVKGIWADYSGLVDRHQPAFLLLVTRNGLASGAQAYVNAEQSNLRHQTIWELENETLGLADYVRHLAGLFDHDGLSQYYIESTGRRITYGADHVRHASDEAMRLFDELQLWIADDDRRPLAVLGGYGAGKTSLARRLVAMQAQTALADPLARRPVLIRLGELSRYAGIEGLLGGMFTFDFPVDGFNVRRFLDLNAKGRLLIVLDGFDEMKHAMSWADFRHQIADLNRFTGAAAKVVLLGRPSAFTSTDEHFHVLRGLKKWDGGYRRLPDWPDFIEYELSEFTREERSRFIAGYLAHRATHGPHAETGNRDWIARRVEEVDRLADADPDLFGKPVHAKILVDMAADPKVDLSRFADGITRWGLYEVFFQSLAERESEKAARRPIAETGRLDFLREVAFWLWTEKAGATSFSAADLPDRLVAGLPQGDAADPDSLKREYLTGSFLEKKSGDVYYFGHRSFAEYLVAERMLTKAPSPAEQSVYSALVRDGVLTFLKEAPDRQRFTAWLDTISNAQGNLHVEYLVFLGYILGGRDALHDALVSTSIWRPILGVFEPDMTLNGHAPHRIVEAMQDENNNLFFLLLSLLLYQSQSLGGRRQDVEAMIAAALLNRVFVRATIDEASRKAFVTAGGNDARQLAQMVVPEIESGLADRELVFRGAVLLREHAEALRKAGVDLTYHPPATMFHLTQEARLSWSAVLGHMSREGREEATRYFRLSNSLSGVFTKNVKPPSRAPRVR